MKFNSGFYSAITLFFLSINAYAACPLISDHYEISLQGVDKAKVIQILYDNARRASGRFDAPDLSSTEASEILESAIIGFIPEIHGIRLHVSLEGSELNTFAYNLRYGKNAAEVAICHALHPYGHSDFPGYVSGYVAPCPYPDSNPPCSWCQK